MPVQGICKQTVPLEAHQHNGLKLLSAFRRKPIQADMNAARLHLEVVGDRRLCTPIPRMFPACCSLTLRVNVFRAVENGHTRHAAFELAAVQMANAACESARSCRHGQQRLRSPPAPARPSDGLRTLGSCRRLPAVVYLEMHFYSSLWLGSVD